MCVVFALHLNLIYSGQKWELLQKFGIAIKPKIYAVSLAVNDLDAVNPLLVE